MNGSAKLFGILAVFGLFLRGILSGSFLSGSFLSGSFLSGSFLSGCFCLGGVLCRGFRLGTFLGFGFGSFFRRRFCCGFFLSGSFFLWLSRFCCLPGLLFGILHFGFQVGKYREIAKGGSLY